MRRRSWRLCPCMTGKTAKVQACTDARPPSGGRWVLGAARGDVVEDRQVVSDRIRQRGDRLARGFLVTRYAYRDRDRAIDRGPCCLAFARFGVPADARQRVDVGGWGERRQRGAALNG